MHDSLDGLGEYARIGLTHHMLFPRCMTDPDYHLGTLLEFAARNDMETLDCCIPFGDERRRQAVAALKKCGKEVVYALHLFPVGKISLSSTDPQEQGFIKLGVSDQIELAARAGARGLIFRSGADVPESQRPAARNAFRDFCRWLSAAMKRHGMTAMLEPFDRTFDRKQLYGPTEECVQLVESLGPETDNLKIELDVAHLPLMGEEFEHAFRTVAPYLARVHLGNCVRNDPLSAWYGDKHPPVGLPGGEIDVPELAEVLRICLQIGYLNRKNRGALVFEMQTFPGATVEETIADNRERLRKAWTRARSR